MDFATLTNLGLSDNQACVYVLLIKLGSLSPPDVVKELNIKRTNSYAILDQLVELGLARKKEVDKFNTYFPENPVILEKLAREIRTEAMEYEQKVHQSLPTLLKYYNTYSEKPGVRYFEGINEIKEIYNDTLRTGKDIYVFRSPKDQDLLTTDYYIKYKKQRAKLGIKTHILNSSDDTSAWNEQNDTLFNLERTQLCKGDYTADVEIAAYGGKVSIISFGDEAMGMIIDSPQIAEAIKQIFQLVKSGIESRDVDA